MSGFPLPVPAINGHYFSFASIEASFGVQKITDFTEINYESILEKGDVYGTRPQKLGRTRGKQNATASFGMYLRAWERLRNLIAPPKGVGYGEIAFPITVMYAELGQPVITDILEQCLVTNVARAHSDGTDAAKVTVTLNVLRILEGKTGMIAAPIGVGF
jgi:hypothetical protein